MTQKASSWQRKAVPMAHEGCPHDTGRLLLWDRRASSWHNRNPSDERKSPTDAHSHALADFALQITDHQRGSKMQAT
jgi:hypothetical protein